VLRPLHHPVFPLRPLLRLGQEATPLLSASVSTPRTVPLFLFLPLGGVARSK
jgi:hypothetical protein